jgi:hypothetical protein
LAALLLRGAVVRAFRPAQDAGIALTEDAKHFYQRWSFVESPYNAITLVARLKDLE